MASAPSESRKCCPVHGDALQQVRMRVEYGLPEPPPPGYEEAAERTFPFGGEPPLGGCCVPSTPEFAVVPVCRRCEEARRAWLARSGRRV